MYAIIFDMDGVIIDTSPIIDNIVKMYIKELGHDLTTDLIKKYKGTKSEVFWAAYKKQFSLPNSINFYMEEARNRYLKWFEETEQLPISPGIRGFIDNLIENNFLTAIATSGSEYRMNLILTKLILQDKFRVKVSSADIKNSKPCPDIFNVASKLLGVPNTSCIVIEDSTNGVIAAKKANMLCVGFKGNSTNNQDLSDADFVIEDFRKFSVEDLKTAFSKFKAEAKF